MHKTNPATARRRSNDDWFVPSGCEYFDRHSALPPAARDRLDCYAYDYGDTYDSYLATENDRRYFWSPGRRGVIGFVHWRGVLNVLGGLLAPPQHRVQLLKCFLEFVQANDLTVNFFNVGRKEEQIFRRHNFQINKCAEELLVRLQQVNWQGKQYAWLRRQENYCIRQRVRVEEVVPDSDPVFYREEVVPQLEEVNRQHLASTVHGRELVFFEGRFDPWSLRRRRLFIASQAGQIVAFVVCNPALAGDLWAIEIYRRSADAPRGVMPFAMLQVMRQLKDEGVLYASLSSVPFIRCGPPMGNDDLRFQAACQFLWTSMNWLFDVRGIYHFKSRFRPAYREMFLATYPKMTIRSMFALPASWGLLHVSPARLARHLFHFWRGRKERQKLARPEPRPERKLRALRRRRQASDLGEAPTASPPMHLDHLL